jgi:signal transduction histidine kinase
MSAALERILVVEDEAIIAMDLERSLEQLGYVVCGTADTPQAALHLADRERPSLVLMDVMLRDRGDGVAAADAIQHRMGVPVVFVSAHSDPDTLARARQTAPYGYLVKPFQPQELNVAIQTALARRRRDEALEHKARALEAAVAASTDELEQKKHALDFALRARRDFLMNVSHELRTPLHHILGYTMMLQHGDAGGLSPPQQAWANELLAAGHRLAALVDALISVADLSYQRVHLVPNVISIEELLRVVGAMVAGPAAERRVTLRIERADGAPATAWGEMSKLSQALAELVDNAIRYNDVGGWATLRVELGPRPGLARFVVEDGGPGVPEEFRDQIFDDFARGQVGGLSRSVPGLGLGLSVARRIVELHGATLRYEPALPRGSRFVFDLPVAPGDADGA